MPPTLAELQADVRRCSIADPYDWRANAETFDLEQYLAGLNPRLLASAEGRQALTYADPFAFSLVYLRHHLTSEETGLSFGDCHLDWFRYGRQWMIKDPGLRGWRHSFASPRNSGKSTIWYTIMPIWAAAHQHKQFVASFANGGTQAEMHLQTFRSEAAENERLRQDFPDLCTAIRKPTGRTVADNEGHFQSQNGFVWIARGIDVASLGMKVGNTRPDVLILDDIEKDEAQYSPGEVEKRRKTLIDAIMPLNERAALVLVGTVTRPGSINHQLVKVATGEVDPDSEEGEKLRWIRDERITPHYYPPLVERSDGTRRSIWPAKWSAEYLQSIEHTVNYQKNFKNNPRAESGDYWKEADIRYNAPPADLPRTRRFMFVDPPTTMKTRSDPAGICVLSYFPGTGKLPTAEERIRLGEGIVDRESGERVNGWRDTLTREEAEAQGATRLSRVVVEHAEETRATGTPLKKRIVTLLERFPDVEAVLIEVNQGGDLWIEVMTGLPCRVITFHSSEPKEVRIKWGLEMYQRYRVTHRRRLVALEDQQTAYPKIEHDDIVDAVATGCTRLLKPRKKMKDTNVRQR